MPIPNANFGEVLFLLELDLNCKLFKQAFAVLEVAAQHRISLEKGIDDGKPGSPLQIVAECTVCLSSLAAIRRILSPSSKDTRAQERASTIRDLLGNPALPNVTSVKVRNSWEHLDERLDAVLEQRAMKKWPVVPIHVSPRGPDTSSFVLRRFDPVTFAIHFAGETIQLRPCIEEINDLANRINVGYQRLNNEESGA